MTIHTVGSQDSSSWTSRPPAADRIFVDSDTTVAQLAARLGISVADLLRANPELAGRGHLRSGTEINVPERRSAAGDENATDPSSNGAPTSDSVGIPSEDELASPAMKAKVNAANGTSDPDAPQTGDTAPSYLSSDPRFSDLNAALGAGDGAGAIGAAGKLITQLSAAKPPNEQLLNEARMGLAAGAMMDGKTDEAKKALLAVSAKRLSSDDKQKHDELLGLLKEMYRGSFNESFQADTAPDAKVQDRGKQAADQARNLLDVLQKTEPGNRAEIDETRLKLSNALLLGGHYREAEKALNGIDQNRLGPQQAKYLQANQQEIHAQQIVALSAAYGRDIRQGRYAQAVQNATAAVNDLSKYFPESKAKIMAARLDQSTAQLRSGDIAGSRKSLSRVTAEEFKAASPEVQQYYGRLKNQVDQAAREKAEQADIQHQLETIHRLLAAGDKDSKNDAQAMAAKLLADVQRKHPFDTKAIEAMKLTVADIAIATGDTAGGAGLAKEVADKTQDEDVKDQAQMTQVNAALADNPPKLNEAGKMLRSIAENGSSEEARREGKQMLISMESDHIASVAQKADDELKGLLALKKKNIDDLLVPYTQGPREIVSPSGVRYTVTPDSTGELGARDLQQQELRRIAEPHKEATDQLNDISKGAKLAISVMKTNGLTAADLETMDYKKLATLPGVGSEADAKVLRKALNMSDMDAISKDDFQGGKLSWQQHHMYVDPSYLDTPGQRAVKWIGEQVRTARAQDDVMVHSGSWLQHAVGWTSAHVLDGISAANGFVKDRIDVAYDFYQRQGGVLGKIGMAATFVADMGSQVVTTPATVIDYKATDEQRADAIKGTALMFAGGAVLSVAGPAFGELAGAAGESIASSALGRRVAQSWVGDAAKWTVRNAKAFENTRFAKGVDKVTDKLSETLGKTVRFRRPKTDDSLTAKGSTTPGGVGTGDLAKGTATGATDLDAAATLDMPKAGDDTTPQPGAATAPNASAAPSSGAENGYPVARTTPSAKRAVDLSDVVVDVVGDQTAGQIGASITPQKVEAMESKLVQKEYRKAVAQKKAELKKSGQTVSDKEARAILESEYPNLNETLRSKVRGEFSEEDIKRILLTKEIYKKGYHGDVAPRPVSLTERQYTKALDAAKGPKIGNNAWDSPDATTRIKEDDTWHHRFSKDGGGVGLDSRQLRSGENMRRIYFDVKPDYAADLTDYLNSKLNAPDVDGRRMRWQFKVGKNLSSFDRPDPAVLYIDKSNYEAAKQIVMEYAKTHPDAFSEEIPALTEQISRGIAMADEPIHERMPKTPGGKHSFGESRSAIIADAILKAPPGATKDEILAIVRERMRAYSLDPDRPWLADPSDPDNN